MKLSSHSSASVADELLKELLPQKSVKAGSSKRESLQVELENRSLGVDTIAEKLQEQLYCGDKSLEDKALEKLMRIHNVLPKEETRELPQIVLNIQGNSPTMAILLPDRS